MKTNKLQQLMDGTLEALAKSNASDYFQKLLKTVSRQFIIYADERGIDSFNIDVGLQFLEDHYSMSQKIAEKKWCSMYLRCINAISEYQMTGAVDMYLTTARTEYTFPEPFKESAESYLAYRVKIGIIPKSIQISRLYLFRFFSFLESKNIISMDVITVPVVLDTDYFFMAPDRTKISPMTIYQRYRRYLTGAGISHGGKGHGPRLHDLRHTFAVHVLQKWITEGADLTAMMPILSTYMGHMGIRSTAQYLRLTAEVYPELMKQVEKICSYVIPEVAHEGD